MNRMIHDEEFDAIIVGSGTCGATLARELTLSNKKVLMLERGGNTPLKESVLGFASIADEVPLGNKMTTVRALTTGGSTGLYFGVVNYPPVADFLALGIDLSAELEQVTKELPIAPLPDELIGEQSLRLRNSALDLGHSWHKHDMLVDQSKCQSGYSYDSKWKARSFVDDAIRQGASLINGANVSRILIDKNQAVGVEFKLKKNMLSSETRRVYGTKIILAAGELASPKILRDTGIQGIGDRGFFCEPGYALYGIVPGLRGKNNFVGSMGCIYEDGIELGDANVSQTLHRLMMFGSFKFKHLLNYSEGIGIGVKVKDDLGGRLDEKGCFTKELGRNDYLKLKKAEAEALKVLKRAGAKHIFNVGLTSAGHVGGLVRIQDHVDDRLETQFKNLHVCDGSILPEAMRITPTLTLVCLARYLSKHLLASL